MANQQNNNPKDRNQTQAGRDNPAQQGGQGQDRARQPQQENDRNRQPGSQQQVKPRDPQRNA